MANKSNKFLIVAVALVCFLSAVAIAWTCLVGPIVEFRENVIELDVETEETIVNQELEDHP
jgi:hypothetical protein